MQLSEFITRESILPNLLSTTREGVLAELVKPLLQQQPVLKSVNILAALCEREKLGSTAVGDGVAIPHCKVPVEARLSLGVGRSRAGVHFHAPDKRLCHIFFVILAPENRAGQHLRLLTYIARKAKDPVFRSEVLLSQNREQIWQAVTAP